VLNRGAITVIAKQTLVAADYYECIDPKGKSLNARHYTSSRWQDVNKCESWYSVSQAWYNHGK